jgi:hypothetical protein
LRKLATDKVVILLVAAILLTIVFLIVYKLAT